MSQPVNQINELIYRHKYQIFVSETGYQFVNPPAPGQLVSNVDPVATGIANKQVIRYLTKLGTRYVWFSAGIHPITNLIENAYVEVNKKRETSKTSGQALAPMRLSENMIWGQPQDIIQEIYRDAKKRSVLRYWISWCIVAREQDDFIKQTVITKNDVLRLKVYMNTHYTPPVIKVLKRKQKRKNRQRFKR